MERTCEDGRSSVGPLGETRAWLDQLFDVGVRGLAALRAGKPLCTPEFDDWLEATHRGGKASQALLASAVASAMDGGACDAVSMVWLVERFAEGLWLASVLAVLPPPVQAGEPPLSGPGV